MIADEPRPTEQIGPYRITGRLGRGGMGEVLEGYDDRLDRRVALKRVQPGHGHSDNARRRLRREARLAGRLNHPAIVQVHDWVEDGDQDWLVMELVEGRTLTELLARGRPSLDRALRIAREIAAGLAAAHDAGLVHRDLKASNVMLADGTPSASGRAPREQVKILDFGIAKPVAVRDGVRFSTLTDEGQIVGTVHAMSPEQALGQPVDHRSDLFALGTLLYEMLSGESPFLAQTPIATLSRICSHKQPALRGRDPWIPEDVSRFVDRLLMKQPGQRPASAWEVMDRLDGWLAESPAAPGRPVGGADRSKLAEPTLAAAPAGVESTGSASRPWVARHRRGVLAAGLGALILVGSWGLASWWEPWLDEPPVAEQTSHEYFKRGMDLLDRYDKEGHIDRAIWEFRQALGRNSESAPAHAGLSRAYLIDESNGSMDSARLEQALDEALQAVELDEFLALARVSLGASHLEMGNLEGADRELERALQIEPLNAGAFYHLGNLAVKRRDLATAESYYRQAIDARPDFWLYHAQLGSTLRDINRLEDAAEAFSRSLELAPDNYLIHRNLGAVHIELGDLRKAATEFQRSLQIRPQASVYSNLGSVLFAQGLYEESAAAFEKAIETLGSRHYLHYIYWGNLADALRWSPGRESEARAAYERALELLDEELAKTTESPTLRTIQALYLSKLGDCDRVPERISALAELAREEGAAWNRLVVASEICGRRDNAFAALEKALRAGYPVTAPEGDPELHDLRQDARYDRLIRQLSSPS